MGHIRSEWSLSSRAEQSSAPTWRGACRGHGPVVRVGHGSVAVGHSMVRRMDTGWLSRAGQPSAAQGAGVVLCPMRRAGGMGAA